MAFEIPKEEIPALKALKEMPSASLEELVLALKKVPPSSDTPEMAKRIAKRVPAIAPKKLEAVLDTLYGIYYIRELSGVSRSHFLGDFIDGMQNVPSLRVPESQVSGLKVRFEKLLSISTFDLLSKAKRLQRDGERLYCDAKIFSDIRPVFGAKPTARPTGAVVTHTLKVGYHEGGEHREFHIVLDGVDLEALTDVIFRARDKDTTLRALLKDAHLEDMGV